MDFRLRDARSGEMLFSSITSYVSSMTALGSRGVRGGLFGGVADVYCEIFSTGILSMVGGKTTNAARSQALEIIVYNWGFFPGHIREDKEMTKASSIAQPLPR